jgi:hypothetical protein
MRLDTWMRIECVRLSVIVYQEDNFEWTCTIEGRPHPTEQSPATFILGFLDVPITVRGSGTTADQAYAATVKKLVDCDARLAIVGHGRTMTIRIPRTLTT